MDVLNSEFIYWLATAVFMPIAIKSLLLAWKLARIDGSRFKYTKKLAGSPGAVISGRVNTRKGNVRSHEIRAGLAYSKDSHRLETRGNLSDDCVDAFLKS